MKRRKKSLRIPWSIRAIINLILIVLLIPVYYISVECPPLSVVHQFRRVEKAEMVGPARILDTISLKKYGIYGSSDQLLIATSDEGVTLFTYDADRLVYSGNLVYREKQRDVTVLAVPGMYLKDFEMSPYVEIPILVFDCFPEAVRAEMEIELSVPDLETSETVFQKKYELTAARDAKDYFVFELAASKSEDYSMEYKAIELLCMYSDESGQFDPCAYIPFPVTIRFYNQNDNMIGERHIEIRTPAGEAHAKK